MLSIVNSAGMAVLQNDEICLSVDPSHGARVVELRNQRSGRDWMAPVERSAEHGAEQYGGAQAAGWDECFPTVAPCEEVDPDWGRPLRDHGELWGRPWRVRCDDSCIESMFSTEEFSFTRVIRLSGSRVDVDYSVTCSAGRALSYLWSQHCVLAVKPGDQFEISGFDAHSVTHCEHRGEAMSIDKTSWVDIPHLLAFLRKLPSKDLRFATKVYGSVADSIKARVGQPDDYLCIEWQADAMPFAGLWLNFGGWPSAAPLYHLAVEPTTAPADHLAGARAASCARLLQPGTEHRWAIRMSVGR